ncbi:MAG: hypothetical protein K6F92_00980 [Lachnospiraceae bacterium]|nr:hypothetical protein [Lachnospiraceae bacterium]
MDIYKGEFFLENLEDGGIKIGYNDYGDDYDLEAIYTLDAKNTKKFVEYLVANGANPEDSLRNKIITVLGIHLDKKSLTEELDNNKIEYEKFVWID